MPGVLRMDGLSALGLKACCPAGIMRGASVLVPCRAESGICCTARAEKKAIGSAGLAPPPPPPGVVMLPFAGGAAGADGAVGFVGARGWLGG